MPLTDKGKEIMANLVKEYGPEKGESVFYAMKNEGKLTGVDSGESMRFYVTEQLSEHIGETPEGFLVCHDVPITRIGEFIYRANEVPVTPDSSGTIRIQRDEDEVFADTTILSFEGKPVTIDHPSGFVSPENWQELAHGTIQNVRRGQNGQGDLLLADLLITTEEAIKLVKSGLREVSCGYDAQYEEIEKGLGRQREIIGNHVALVSKGRAGGRCAIGDKTCDGCGNCNCSKQENKTKEEIMALTMKQRIKKWLDAFPVKDEDIDEEEEAKKKAAEEEALKAEDRKAKDQDEEEEKKEEKEEEKETADKKVKDQEGAAAAILERLARLEEIIAMLVKTDEAVHEESGLDKKCRDDEEEEAFVPEKEEEFIPEEEMMAEEEERMTGDSIKQWSDLAHRAEILFPGMSLKKPTKDHARVMREVKVIALKGALTRDGVRDTVFSLLKGRRPEKLTKDALDAVFTGASEVLSKLNNSQIQKKSIGTHDFSTALQVADINRKNKEFYGSKPH